jgi:hypothetical protein
MAHLDDGRFCQGAKIRECHRSPDLRTPDVWQIPLLYQGAIFVIHNAPAAPITAG